MITGIAWDADTSWDDCRRKLARLTTMPQLCYLRTGSGLWDDEQLVLISDTPWTMRQLLTTLVRIYTPGDLLMDPTLTLARYTDWLTAWLVLEGIDDADAERHATVFVLPRLLAVDKAESPAASDP